MTKKMIDADVLDKLLDEWILEQENPKDQFDMGYLACLYFIKNEINELSIPSQVNDLKNAYQSVFDYVLSLKNGNEYENTLKFSKQIKGTKGSTTFLNGYTTALNVVLFGIKQKIGEKND